MPRHFSRDHAGEKSKKLSRDFFLPADISMAFPSLQTMHRESPALATYNLLPRIKATTAVHPESFPG